jgi:tetratricopeptide (TPR) repeat protein
MRLKLCRRWGPSVIAVLSLCFGSAISETAVARILQQTPAQETQALQNLDNIRELIKNGKYAEAETLARKLLAENEVTFGADSVKTAEVLDVLVEALFRGGKAKQPESREFAERAIEIKKNILGSNHPEVAVSLNNLAIILNIIGDFAGARPLFEQALAIREQALPPDHPEVARSLNNLANLLRNIGNFTEAKPLYERALRIREKTFGPDHPEVAITLNNLAILLKDMGDYAGARLLYERTLTIREKTLGPEHPEVAIALNNLANLLTESGDYVGARPLHQRALAIREKSQGSDHPATATTLMNLANLYRNLGDYTEATPLYQRAIAIEEKALGSDHPDVAMTIENFAILLLSTGDYAGARPLYERSLVIMEKTFGPNHPLVATHLDDLADLLRVTGDYAEARPLYERALAIRENVLGPDHWRVAASLDNLASLFIAMGDYANARPLSERALSIWEKAFGLNYHYAAESLYNLARLFHKTGDAAKVLDAALRAEQITREHFRLTARTLAERQALRYASVRTSGLDLALSIVSEGVFMDSTQQAFDALIRTRALVLDEMASRHRAVSSVNDSSLVRLSQALASARQRLANLTVRGPSDDKPERYLRLLDEARQEKERAEQALAEKSAAFRQEQARSRIGFADVAAALSPGSAMVAFARYDHHKSTTKESASTSPNAGVDTAAKSKSIPSYLVFILHGGESKPAVVPLGNAQEIEALISRWSEEAARGIMMPRRSQKQAEAAYRTAGELLRQKI